MSDKPIPVCSHGIGICTWLNTHYYCPVEGHPLDTHHADGSICPQAEASGDLDGIAPRATVQIFPERLTQIEKLPSLCAHCGHPMGKHNQGGCLWYTDRTVPPITCPCDLAYGMLRATPGMNAMHEEKKKERLAQLEAIERAWKWIEEHRADVASDDDNWRVTWWNGEEWAIETGSTRLQAVQKAMAAGEGER